MKRLLSTILCLCMLISILPANVFAAATNITVTSANYYDNDDLKSVNISCGWDSAAATSRLVVMTERLRSAGEDGTDGTYGDFTDRGYYGKQFNSWDTVIEQKDKFGILYYTDEQRMRMSKSNSITLNFNKGDIPINVDKTYYVYLWTCWGGQYYPDNLFMVLQVKNGLLQYASATERNEYGEFTTLKEGNLTTSNDSKSSTTTTPSDTSQTNKVDSNSTQANGNYPTGSTEIIVKDGQRLYELTSGYRPEQFYSVKKIVLDCSYDEAWKLEYDGHTLNKFSYLEELWFGPNVDVVAFLNAHKFVVDGLTGDNYAMSLDASNLDTRKVTIFASDTKYKGFGEAMANPPEGYGVFNGNNLYRRFVTKLYSGDDVMKAYVQGPSAGYEWCTSHDYSADIYTPDRVYTMKSCHGPIRYYYSCSKCGKCEYNPNHTLLVNPNYTFHWDRMRADPCIEERNLSDCYFIGINSRGERVYWKSCVMCGKTYNEDYAGTSIGGIWAEQALENSTLKQDGVVSFSVSNDRYVTAKMSEWAQNEVQWASQNGILDTSFLGNDYTKPITRLQFASIAVKLAEVLTGSAIIPAPQGTFADTDNEYALKAYASGITSGVSATEFNPNGTLTRQQMATFIYRALMYVRDNTNIRYTTYTPALEQYSDNWAIADWARTSMGFMNALGLVKGVSDTAIDPDGTCTIEQAALVANRSVNADQIGWYQVRPSTEVRLLDYNKYDCGTYLYAPTDLAPTQTHYRYSDRIWVDTPSSRDQKASANPDVVIQGRFLITTEPYTGSRAYVDSFFFKPIKD